MTTDEKLLELEKRLLEESRKRAELETFMLRGLKQICNYIEKNRSVGLYPVEPVVDGETVTKTY